MVNTTYHSFDEPNVADTGVFGFAPQALPDLVRYQAQHHPLQRAVLSEEGEVTFAQLDERSNRLAQALIKYGIRYGDRVVLQGKKSLNFVLFQLAILKLGAAFIPLASGLPMIRRSKILADAKPAAIIIEDVLVQKNEPTDEIQWLTWSQVEHHAAHLTAQDPAISLSGGDIAWVFYTSGSTGTPKGVVGTHGASLKRCAAMSTLQPVSSQEVIAHLMPDTAIDAIWEVWAPLGFGLPVVLIDTQRYTDPKQIVALLAKYQVTQICMVSSYLKLLLNSGLNLTETLPMLQTWITTGESASRLLVDLFFQCLPSAILLNQYGLTETLATATCCTMTKERQGEGQVSIGEPITGIQCWILDDNFQPFNEGEVGHLCMGGEALASGYLASPALTADRFRPNPFAMDGSRLYLSGDLAAKGNDGKLRYHGREDRCINLLGHRVELGEIEAAMAEADGVKDVGVVWREQNEQPEIYGFYVSDKTLTKKHLINHLNARLPCYMVPAYLQPLAVLPKLLGGKTDYRTLVAQITISQTAIEYTSSDVEQNLLVLINQLLGIAISDLDANFFEYGGNSIMAIRLINEIRQYFHIDLEIADIYHHQTIRALIQAILNKKLLQETR
ncbi:non-ribosomal peptide synthetase [Xenorhabdus bovienii]|uniref:non-ribosomal peptide synthetase n=1 Tax=Xenorhabdus bovienii TaxID=40576 RepID=UPI0023B25471|nr:non-ribosomal peptide synthetase [Xenorhabdus bovienii]MDE9430274.1 non-ribosomal peptide synthetase [Xenorhabdus bovienii]